jgi:gamma-glutamyltranspeptidase/glutathione hydrolase
MGPPSSGALTVGQILGMLDRYDLRAPESADARLIGDAPRWHLQITLPTAAISSC